MSIAPIPGPGRFQWNAGGWFGSQLGGTAWMLVGAAVMAPHAPLIATWWLTCFALVNAAGTWLWLRRDRVRPYPAIQALLACCGGVGLLALAALDLFGPGEAALSGSLRPGYAALLVMVPALMGFFAFLEWAARRERQGA